MPCTLEVATEGGMMQPDLWALYRQMLRSRLFEQAVKRLWEEGLISGEMHLAIGEVAAVVLEAGIPVRYARVCTRGTIPYARDLEDEALPSTRRIVDAALQLREKEGRQCPKPRSRSTGLPS